MKTRREFIQGLILSVGGAATLSACGDNSPAVTATAPNNPGRFYTSEEMALVSRVSDLIIPRKHPARSTSMLPATSMAS